MKGSNIVLECLKKEGVDTIFGYPGGAVIPLYDALYDYKEDFNHIRTCHEQGLVHAADGYARSTGKTGVCFVTSGPGATNAVTGIATAYMDSSPLVVITGQVPTSLLGKDSFQEVDITGVTLSITKHNYLVRKVEDIAKTIKEAFRVANTGRKGPVLIDIPKNLFLDEVDFDIDDYIPYSKENSFIEESKNLNKMNKGNFHKAVDLINKSKRPVIYAGGGVKSSEGGELLDIFSKKIDTPVLNTLMGLGGIDRSNELSLGMVGMHGSKESNLALSNSDLIIAIGARFSDRVVGKVSEFAKKANVIHIDIEMHGSKESNLALSNSDLIIAIGARFSDRVVGKVSEFAKKANVIHIDIDPSEVNKNINTDVFLIGDIKDILDNLINTVSFKDNKDWKLEIQTYKEESKLKKDEFHPENILKVVNDKVSYNGIVVTDVGQHQMWAAKYWNFSQGNTFITSAGLGTMGFGLGAAIGSKIGNKNKNVVLVTGDGSFRMNCNELGTVSKYNIPIIILLFNNNALGMVRQWQKLFSNCRYSETDIDNNLDYVMLGKAYGIDGYKVENLDELKVALNKAQKLFSNCRYSETDIDNNLDYVMLGKAYGIDGYKVENLDELKVALNKADKLFSNCRYSETDIDNNLDYVMLGKAYGIDGYKVENLDELKVALNKADLNKPVIFECNINKDYDVYPIVPPNDALENLICH